MNTKESCPQCKKEVNESTNRLIQDTCGHRKCRICLLQDETSCKICDEKFTKHDNALKNNCNTSVIKFDAKTVVHNNGSNIVTNSVNEIDDNYSTELIEINKLSNKIEYSKDCEPHEKIPHIVILSRTPPAYKCTICSKSFSTKASVKYHSYCGGIDKPLKCDICNKGFISRSHLETHKLKHSGIRPFSCSRCQKTFTQKSKLNRHLKLHTGDRPFVCSECGKNFTNKDALIGHFRLHSGEQPYSCKHCGNRFNNKSNLTKHLATHTSEKLYMCDECGKKFGNKWALISHRKCHDPKRPYNCQKCNKSFSKIKDLKRHNLTHLDVKPFCCNLCHMRFCRKDNLERHLKNTHSIKDVKAIKSASTKLVINDKLVESMASIISNSKHAENATIIDVASANHEETQPSFQEKPNAIHVIKMSTSSTLNPVDVIPTIRNAVPVINGPFKLAFKTDAFKNNYNILNREYTEQPPRIQTKKPYDMAESLNICQKILSPMNTAPINDKLQEYNIPSPINTMKNVIMSVGKVNERDSLEICKKILTPNDNNNPPLHYETSFEHKKHAEIKNIKFKLPSTYTNNALKSASSNHELIISSPEKGKSFIDEELDSNNCIKEYANLQPVVLNYHDDVSKSCKQSVIVNPDCIQKNATFSEMHWRRRTSQNLQPKVNHL